MQEQERKAKGERTYVPETKAKPAKRNIAKEKRDRMVEYGRKVTGIDPLKFIIEKPEPRKIDHKDMKNTED